jgi:hypothetical protein
MFKTFKLMGKDREKRRGRTSSPSFTVTVGAKPSDAQYYLTNVSAVHEMLERLASSEKGGGMRRSFSTTSVDRSSGSGLGGLSGGRGSMGLLTKEVMRGSRSNLQDMESTRTRVHSYSDVDTRTSKEGVVKEKYFTKKKQLKSQKGSRKSSRKSSKNNSGMRGDREMVDEGENEMSARSEEEGWQDKLWKSKWFLLAVVVSMMILRRR